MTDLATNNFLRTVATGAFLLIVVLAKAPKHLVIHGDVECGDESSPLVLVSIEKVCKGVVEEVAFASSEGNFKIDLGPAESVSEADLAACSLQAYLPGYRSQRLPLAKVSIENPEAGTLTLKPLGKQPKAPGTNREKEVSSKSKKLMRDGLNAAAKANLKAAEDLFEQSVAAFHWFPADWLNLGMLQERRGDLSAAKKSFKESMAADDGFVLAHLYAAGVEIARQDWQEALADSAKVIELDPEAFPRAYLLNAQANLNLHNVDDAEKRANEGLKLDDEHRFPELEYVLALVAMDRGDRTALRKHLESYLAMNPHGAIADAAREQLKQP